MVGQVFFNIPDFQYFNIQQAHAMVVVKCAGPERSIQICPLMTVKQLSPETFQDIEFSLCSALLCKPIERNTSEGTHFLLM